MIQVRANLIGVADFHGFANRICEGTEQILCENSEQLRCIIR